jgi:hypothetical protein
MLEETGYKSEQFSSIGVSFANPANQTNKAHVFLANNAIKTQEAQPEPGE